MSRQGRGTGPNPMNQDPALLSLVGNSRGATRNPRLNPMNQDPALQSLLDEASARNSGTSDRIQPREEAQNLVNSSRGAARNSTEGNSGPTR